MANYVVIIVLYCARAQRTDMCLSRSAVICVLPQAVESKLMVVKKKKQGAELKYFGLDCCMKAVVNMAAPPQLLVAMLKAPSCHVT